MQNHRHPILLIEVSLVILFFALSQAVLLQVFAKAQQVNHRAAIQNHALMCAQNTAETLAGSIDPEQTLSALGYVANGNQYLLIDPEGYRIEAVVTRFTQPTGILTTIALKVYNAETELFSLPAVIYREVNPA